MDDLTNRKAVRDGMMKYGFHAPDMTVHEFVEDELHSVPAVPLDKLCEWLAKFGCPCDINEDMCDQAHGVDRCLGIFNSSAFCWQYLLTKMMEEQDAPN
jgi:hypothetical protein